MIQKLSFDLKNINYILYVFTGLARKNMRSITKIKYTMKDVIFCN